jgi:hypothetical protein
MGGAADTICTVVVLNHWLTQMVLSFQHPARCVLVVFALLLVTTSCDPSTASRPHSTAPVVYFQRAPVTGWQAIDWTGKLHGSVGSDQVGNPYQSPDGSGLLWDPNGAWQIVNRTGHVLSLADMTDSRGLAWADDSSGMCILRGTSSE